MKSEKDRVATLRSGTINFLAIGVMVLVVAGEITAVASVPDVRPTLARFL